MNSVLITCFIISCAVAQDCVWNKETEFPTNYPPLLIEPSQWQAFLPVVENGENVVRIPEDTSVIVACPGETLAIGGEVAEGICQKGFLVIDGNSYHISELACDARVDDDAIIYTDKDCADATGTLSGVGFHVAGYSFYEIIEVCFNTEKDVAINAKHVIYGNSVAASDSNPSRPSFKMGNGFYDFTPNDCYSTEAQDVYFEELLGDPDFIDLNSNRFFSRGHLAPNAAFSLEMEADATYYYINAVPQWQMYNSQNWAYTETATREIASDHGTELEIWTGPSGQLVLDGNLIYHCASQNSDTIPIPELMWKVVYERETNRGVAIVTSNIPHEGNVPIICPDLDCLTIEWIKSEIPEPREPTRGYTYCCTVQDLKSAVPGAPDLPSDVGILT